MQADRVDTAIEEALGELGSNPPGPELAFRWEALLSRETPLATLVAPDPSLDTVRQLLPCQTISSEQAELVADSDILICPMTALRMFPSDTAEAIAVAVREKIPAWLIVSGLEMLSDSKTFLESRLPYHLTRLPDGSEAFVFSHGITERESDRMRRLWAERAHGIFQTSRRRRAKSFLRCLAGEIAVARSAAASALDDLESSLQTGQHGVDALKIEARLVGQTLSEVPALLRDVIDSWLCAVESDIASSMKSQDPAKLRKRLEGAIDKLLKTEIEPVIRERLSEVKTAIKVWAQRSASELERYFRPFWNRAQCAADLSELAKPGTGFELQTSRFVSVLQAQLEEEAAVMRSFLEGSWLAEVLRLLRLPVSKKGKLPAAVGIEAARREAEKKELLARVNESGRRLVEKIENVVTKGQKGLAAVLVDELDARAVGCLSEGSGVMSGAEAVLRRLQAAEDKLPTGHAN